MASPSTPLWKRLWSYISPITLETASSEYNDHLQVDLIEGRHQLTTEDAIYSFDDKYENFNQSFGLINWDKLSGNRVLCLGLGLGSVIYILEKKYRLALDYTAVEIDPEICRLSHYYTTQYLDSYVEVVNTDAEIFLQHHAEQYDLIIMDIFQSAKIPEQFQSKDFLEKLDSLLLDGGLLMYNRMHITDSDKSEYQLFTQNFKNIYPNYHAIPVSQNIVIINDKSYLK
jgi:spermidine synthase